MQMMALFDEFVFVSICVCLTVIVGVPLCVLRVCASGTCFSNNHTMFRQRNFLHATSLPLPLPLCNRAELKLKPIWAKSKSVFDV